MFHERFNFKKGQSFEKVKYLKTIGAGTQNLMRIFLMLSWSVFSSRYQEVWSWAEAPAVGSGAPQYVLMALGCDDSNSSSNRWAVGKICCGSSLIRYCANFCNCSRCNLDSDSLTGALKHTCVGYGNDKDEKLLPLNFEFRLLSWMLQIRFCELTPTRCILWRHTATTWEHQYAVEEQVQLQDVIRRRSKVTATLNWALVAFELGATCPSGDVAFTLALKWKPKTSCLVD